MSRKNSFNRLKLPNFVTFMNIKQTLPKDWSSDDHQIEQHLRNLEKASEMPTLKQRLHREVNFLDFSFVAFKLNGMNSWCIQFIANMLDLFPPHFQCLFKSNFLWLYWTERWEYENRGFQDFWVHSQFCKPCRGLFGRGRFSFPESASTLSWSSSHATPSGC